MKVNGYMLREALDRLELRRRSLESDFEESLYQFEGEDKGNPLEISADLLATEVQIALIQTAQVEYNLQVVVYPGLSDKLTDAEMTLAEAVKRVGGVNRMSKLWENVLRGNERRSSLFGLSGRRIKGKEDELANLQVDKPTALRLAEDYSRDVSVLRAAISEGNAQMVDIEWLTQENLS